jgi:soluble lytic murein transglycosylase-like protein
LLKKLNNVRYEYYLGGTFVERYLFCVLFLFPISLGVEAKTITLNDVIKQAESKYNLPKGLISAVAYVESRHDHKAFVKEDGYSKQSSFGLMQIQLGTARQMGFKGKSKELLRPDINIEFGAAYLRWLLNYTKNDYAKALTCYNAGPYSELCKSGRYSNYSGQVLNALLNQK